MPEDQDKALATHYAVEAEGVAAVPEVLLDDTIAALHQLSRQALAEYAVDIGRTVLDRSFDGSTGTSASRSHDSATSSNARCERRADELKATGLSRGTLRRYVVACDGAGKPPHAVRAVQALATLEQLGRVPDPIQHGEVVLRSTREYRDASTLRARVEAALVAAAPKPSKRGRPRLVPTENALRALTR